MRKITRTLWLRHVGRTYLFWAASRKAFLSASDYSAPLPVGWNRVLLGRDLSEPEYRKIRLTNAPASEVVCAKGERKSTVWLHSQGPGRGFACARRKRDLVLYLRNTLADHPNVIWFCDNQFTMVVGSLPRNQFLKLTVVY